MSTHRNIDRICIVVLVLTLLLTVAFMNGEKLGIRVVADEDAESYSGSTYFTANDLDGDWADNAYTKVHKETSVLVRGASSGVGIAFLKLLKGKYPDAFVTGTSRKAAKAEELIRKGFDRILMDRDGSIDEAEKYDRILELIGPKTIRDSLLHLRDGGIICSAGQLGGQWFLEDFDPIMELQNNVYLTTFYSGNVSVEKMNEMFSFIEANHVDVQPEKVFSLEQVPEAHRWLEQSCGYGKCVVVI